MNILLSQLLQQPHIKLHGGQKGFNGDPLIVSVDHGSLRPGQMHGRKPVRTEWKIFEYYKLDSREWFVQKATDTYLQIVNRETKEEKIIPWENK